MERKQILTTLLALIMLLSVITITYAYFVVGPATTQNQTASVEAGTMSLTFADNDNGVGGALTFGGSITKKFTIENTGTLDAYAKLSWFNITNTYLEGSLVYTLEFAESEDEYHRHYITDKNVPTNVSNAKVELADVLLIPAGKKLYYNLIIKLVNSETVDQTADLNASFWSQFTLENGEKPNIVEELIATSKGVAPTNLFASVATTDEGIYEIEDDYGTSYYFRGNVSNNYVTFAGYCWRIIRINGDGSLRLIYDGTSCHANGESNTDRYLSTKSAFNSSSNDNAYEGYMYGLTGITTDANRCLMLDASNNVVDNVSTYTSKSACESAGGKWTTTAYEATHANVKDSTIKDYLDAWYKTNIVDKGLGDKVADTLFCGDRSMGTSNNLGYKTNTTNYGGYNRLYSARTPQLKCPQKQDAYTVSDETYGNGDLEYPVGLISADEVSLAGGVQGTSNTGYYLTKGSYYWSLSPSRFSGGSAGMFYVAGVGSVIYGDVNNAGGVAPVINLTKEYARTLIGDGSSTNPYRDANDNLN